MTFFFARFRSAVAAVAATFVVAGSVAAGAADLASIEQKNKQVVLDFMSSLETLDMAKTTSYLADDFTYQNGMNGKRNHGVQHFSDWWWGMVENAASLKPTVVRTEAMGNIVIIEKSSVYEDPDTKMTFKGTNFFHVKDGKIKEYQEYRLPK